MNKYEAAFKKMVDVQRKATPSTKQLELARKILATRLCAPWKSDGK